MANAGPSTSRMPRNKRRAQLIDVALDVFAEHGYAHTTMDEVAQQANVSKPVLYQHFQNKRDLYFTLVDFQLQTLRDLVTCRMESVDPDSDTADEQVAYQAVYGVFEFTSEPRGHYRLILDSSMENPAELATYKERFLDDLVKFVSPYILDHSILTPASAHFVTSGIASAVMYLACRWADDNREHESTEHNISLETAVDNTFRFVAHGAIGFDLSNNPSA